MDISLLSIRFYPRIDIHFSLPHLVGIQKITSFYHAYVTGLLYKIGFVILALSPIGEWLYKLIYDYRKIMTNEEKARLIPLFNEVKSSYIKKYKKGGHALRLHIDNSILINAYAVGRKTIVITRGAMYALSDDEIKGLLAHEIGHIHNGDTIVPILLFIGNVYAFIYLIITKVIEVVVNAIMYLLGIEKNNIVSTIIKSMVKAVYFVLTFLIQCLFMWHRRGNEKEADLFALKLGYGKGLLSALYTISRLDVTTKSSPIIERMRSTHPNIFIRIAKLEVSDNSQRRI